MPGNVEKRIECGATFLMTALEAGLSPEDIYLDPITLPINAAFKQQVNVIEAHPPVGHGQRSAAAFHHRPVEREHRNAC